MSDLEFQTGQNYEKSLRKLLRSQKKQVIDIIKRLYPSKKDIVESDGLSFELKFTIGEISTLLIPVLLNAINEAGKSASEILGPPDIEFIISREIRNAIFGATERQLISFNEKTSLKLQKQLAAGIAENETAFQLTKRVESIYKEAFGFRARRIAVTEAHNVTNEGIAMGFKQVGYRRMRWVAFPDACEFCAAMHGTIITIGNVFVSEGQKIEGREGGEFVNNYVDVKYANLHPFCDCRLEPVD